MESLRQLDSLLEGAWPGRSQQQSLWNWARRCPADECRALGTALVSSSHLRSAGPALVSTLQRDPAVERFLDLISQAASSPLLASDLPNMALEPRGLLAPTAIPALQSLITIILSTSALAQALYPRDFTSTEPGWVQAAKSVCRFLMRCLPVLRHTVVEVLKLPSRLGNLEVRGMDALKAGICNACGAALLGVHTVLATRSQQWAQQVLHGCDAEAAFGMAIQAAVAGGTAGDITQASKEYLLSPACLFCLELAKVLDHSEALTVHVGGVLQAGMAFLDLAANAHQAEAPTHNVLVSLASVLQLPSFLTAQAQQAVELGLVASRAHVKTLTRVLLILLEHPQPRVDSQLQQLKLVYMGLCWLANAHKAQPGCLLPHLPQVCQLASEVAGRTCAFIEEQQADLKRLAALPLPNGETNWANSVGCITSTICQALSICASLAHGDGRLRDEEGRDVPVVGVAGSERPMIQDCMLIGLWCRQRQVAIARGAALLANERQMWRALAEHRMLPAIEHLLRLVQSGVVAVLAGPTLDALHITYCITELLYSLANNVPLADFQGTPDYGLKQLWQDTGSLLGSAVKCLRRLLPAAAQAGDAISEADLELCAALLDLPVLLAAKAAACGEHQPRWAAGIMYVSARHFLPLLSTHLATYTELREEQRVYERITNTAHLLVIRGDGGQLASLWKEGIKRAGMDSLLPAADRQLTTYVESLTGDVIPMQAAPAIQEAATACRYSIPVCCCPDCDRLQGPSEALSQPLSPQARKLRLLRCSVCRAVAYDSLACQKRHWAAHKPECAQLAAAQTQ